MDKNYYTYILKCADGSYYTGMSNDLILRVSQHNQGFDKKCYTHSRRPVELVYSESFPEAIYAIQREKQIKGWSRKKKEGLINGDYDRLPELAKSKNTKSSHSSTGSP